MYRAGTAQINACGDSRLRGLWSRKPIGFSQWVVHEHGESKTNDIAEHINLSPARTRALLKEIKEVQAMGGNSNRTYKLENNM